MTGAPRWDGRWREDAWDRAREPLDVLVVGGGITGAGVLKESARRGLRALLVEEGDFASGTSSRSGKLVHGGMRYLRQGRWRLTRSLLLERDKLESRLAGLVEPLEFVLPTLRGHRSDRVAYGAGVRLYDLLRGRRRTWRRYGPEEIAERIPGIRRDGLDGGYAYHDAVTDDARLVIRTLREAAGEGALALNYVRAVGLVREGGRVAGAELLDLRSGATAAVRARTVVNATGVRADHLRGGKGAGPRLRPIRGTHLVLSRAALPLRSAIGFRHPANGRYQYALPWQGVVLVGTTDLDDPDAVGCAPRATDAEVDYLLEGLAAWMPGAGLTREHLLGTFAGVRPVVGTGKADPYREGRDSMLLEEAGLLTVISGKLTAFGSVAERAVRRIAPGAAPARSSGHDDGYAAGYGRLADLDPRARLRLEGRYGREAASVAAAAGDGEFGRVGNTPVLWAEVRWAARSEGVVHLEDLLLRRTPLGLLLPLGGEEHASRLEPLVRGELGWDERRWAEEMERYRAIRAELHGVPGRQPPEPRCAAPGG